MPGSGLQRKPFGGRLRILIADDHAIIRKQVRSIFGASPRFDVCGEARDGAEAIELAKDLKPDVVVLNITMPDLNGFEAAREIKTMVPETVVVILSANADKRFVEEAQKVDARAYVAKTKAGVALITAIEEAMMGEHFVLVD